MRKLITILLLFTGLQTFATKYYVSPSGSNSNNGTSTLTAWQTLSRVQTFLNSTVQPGDSIFFQRGQVFTGTLNVRTIWGGTGKSGTAANPIYIGAYGVGTAPRITGSTTIGSFHFAGVKHYIFDGLNFEDVTFSLSDKVTQAPTACGIRLGQYQEAVTDSCIVKNCSFSNLGGGLVIVGQYNRVDSCTFTNMKNVRNTYSATFPGNDDDYGANPVTICGNLNEVTHSYLSGGWAESYDYGWNGGAIEFFDICNNSKIMYNTIVDCGGIAEFGAYVANATAYNNLIAYNKIINCGSLSYANITGTFTIDVQGVNIYNNVFIENSESRFSGINNGTGIVTPSVLSRVQADPEDALVSFSQSAPSTIPNVFVLKNNVFYIANTGYTVCSRAAVYNKTILQNNVYKFGSGSSIGGAAGSGDVITTAALSAIWEGVGGPAANWNYTPAVGSPAINMGQNLGFTVDFNGKAITGNPDAGIIERTATVTQPFRALLKFVN